MYGKTCQCFETYKILLDTNLGLLIPPMTCYTLILSCGPFRPYIDVYFEFVEYLSSVVNSSYKQI